MIQAGQAIGHQLYTDYQEIGPLPPSPLIVILAGKGNNTGDALVATQTLLTYCPLAQVHIFLTAPTTTWRPHLLAAYTTLKSQTQVTEHPYFQEKPLATLLNSLTLYYPIHICIDGILGVAFHPPLPLHLQTLITIINDFPNIHLRAAIDLPSGIADTPSSITFKADFTYTPGTPKLPLFEPQNSTPVGRIRYLDLNFFATLPPPTSSNAPHLILPSILTPLKALRPSSTEKRKNGHLLLIGGSRNTPGAILMAAKTAATTGTGLLTVLTVKSIQPTLAAALPEAMWLPCEEDSNGLLNPQDVLTKLQSISPKIQAILIGPGIGPIGETLTPLILSQTQIPTVIDAEALQPTLLPLLQTRSPQSPPIILTPHLGEWRRLTNIDPSPSNLLHFTQTTQSVLTLKSPKTLITSPLHPLTYNITGGPVLSRGGTGDILSGLTASLLAQNPSDPYWASCAATYWHGLAADLLAQSQGQSAVKTTDLIDYLPPSLHNL